MDQFIGVFASDKLDNLIEEVNKDGVLDKATYEELYARAEMIGDDFIHDQLMDQLALRYSRIEQLRNRERQLNDELDKVRSEINKLKS